MLLHGTTSVSYLATLTTPVGPGSQVEKHQEVFPHDICCLSWTLYLVMVDTVRSLFGWGLWRVSCSVGGGVHHRFSSWLLQGFNRLQVLTFTGYLRWSSIERSIYSVTCAANQRSLSGILHWFDVTTWRLKISGKVAMMLRRRMVLPKTMNCRVLSCLAPAVFITKLSGEFG